MRSPGEIKNKLLLLRFKERVPFAKIMTDAGVNRDQLSAAMRMEASETIMRRIDAYLNADQLHVVTKETKLLERIREMNQEMWREYRALTIPIKDVEKMSTDRQKRHAVAMNYRLKKLLREKLEKAFPDKSFYFADGDSYWRIKKRLREKARAEADWLHHDDRNGPGPARKGKAV